MRGVKCSWKEMQRLHRQVLPALARGDGSKYAELRCVQPQTVSQWKQSSELMAVLDEENIHLSGYESFQPTHAREIVRHFRKKSKPPWDDDTKDDIVEWVDRCENNGWTVQQLKDELQRSRESDNGEAVSHGIVTDLATLNQQFGCIYADPPWAYKNKATRASVGGNSDAAYKSTMTIEQICAEPVERIAAAESHLHLWTTNAFLRDAFSVIEAWGFTYKSCFVWVKPQMGIGNYWRVSHEFMLLGVRGGLRFRNRGLKSWLEAKRTGHSVKPQQVRQLVEQASPGPYLEMYGREKPMEGWTVYGNEIRKDMF